MTEEHEIPPPTTVQFVDHLVSQLQDYTTPTTTGQPSDGTSDLRHPRLAQNANASAFPRVLTSRMSQVKQLMLTLHCLFPNELLLALDILDRGLVRRYQVEQQLHQRQHHQTGNETATDAELPNHASPGRVEAQSPENIPHPQPSADGVFFVISTSSSSTTKSRVPHTGQKGYEVRLHAWNCSCPTFALAAYRDPGPGPEDSHSHLPPSSINQCSFGGSLTHGATKLTPPVCKHLLACFLAARCPGIVDHGGSSSPSSSSSSVDTVTVLAADELACWCAGWGE